MKKNIVKAEFTSVWDGGYAITTTCKVNIETREIVNIKQVDFGIDDLGSDDLPDDNTTLYWYR